MVIGTPVYLDAANGIKKAKADASGTRIVIGLVRDVSITNGVAGGVMINGMLSATTGQWDAITGQVGGLTFGAKYFLSAATAGLLSVTAPSTVSQYVCQVGIAISTTDMDVRIHDDILL